MNIQTAINESVLFRLNAPSTIALANWTESDLFEFADEYARKLTRATGAFTEYDDAGIPVASATATVALPARHLATLEALLALPASLAWLAGAKKAITVRFTVK